MDRCPRCRRIFGVTEEQCSGCGFDPVNNEEDEEEYDRYRKHKCPHCDGLGSYNCLCTGTNDGAR